MKKILIILFFVFCINPIFATTVDDLTLPKSPANRLGVSDNIESSVKVKKSNKKNNVSKNKAKITKKDINKEKIQNDLSLKKISDDIIADVEDEQDEIYSDLATLWLYTAKNSETIQYAIFKMSNPDENKPDENTLKKIIKPIASVSTIAGTAFAANPFTAASMMMGGTLLSALNTDDKEANYRFTKVNDANMILLIQKIENLQKKLLNLYLDYRVKKQVYEMAKNNVKKREIIYNNIQNKTKEEIILADVYFRNSQNALNKAHDDYIISRNILEQLTGKEAINEIENKK